jgi:hypothetical protein
MLTYIAIDIYFLFLFIGLSLYQNSKFFLAFEFYSIFRSASSIYFRSLKLQR